MFKNGINLEKLINNRYDSPHAPNIHYFLTDDENHNCDGSVDGTPDGLYLGLLQGHSDFKDLIFDESTREANNALLTMSKKVLDMGGRLYVTLGLIYHDGDREAAEPDENGKYEEYPCYILNDNVYSKEIVLEDPDEPYGTGSYGLFIKKDEENGNYLYEYGIQLVELVVCYKPPLEYYYLLEDSITDEVAELIRNWTEKLEIKD